MPTVQHRQSERIFRLLLRLYPRQFREEYREQMVQLFWDQLKETRTGIFAQIAFWLRILGDTVLAGSREHFYQVVSCMNTSRSLFRRYATTFSVIFPVTLILVSGTITIAILYWVPPIYRSTARVAIEKPANPTSQYDPYFIQTEAERIKSRLVLETVIAELNLMPQLSKPPDGPAHFSMADHYEELRKKVGVHQTRSTTLLEVSVADVDGGAAAQIANKIVEVYRRTSEASKVRSKVEIVDPASPGLRPVSPNLYSSLFLGFLSSVAVATVATLIVRLRRQMRANDASAA